MSEEKTKLTFLTDEQGKEAAHDFEMEIVKAMERHHPLVRPEVQAQILLYLGFSIVIECFLVDAQPPLIENAYKKALSAREERIKKRPKTKSNPKETK